MRSTFVTGATVAVLVGLAMSAACNGAAAATSASSITPQAVARVVPGQSTKADVEALFGTPWRVVQFNDCGAAMDDQADETWEYRGSEPAGTYRLHIEFSDSGIVHLIAKIPDASPGGRGTAARFAPSPSSSGMSM